MSGTWNEVDEIQEDGEIVMRVNFTNIGYLWWDLTSSAYTRQVYLKWHKLNICIFQDLFSWYPVVVRHKPGDWELVWLWFDCNLRWK